jgi:hypothetical protein
LTGLSKPAKVIQLEGIRSPRRSHHRAHQDLDLTNVEFSSLPSGLHLVEEDVVYVLCLIFLSLTSAYAGVCAGILPKTNIKAYLCSDGARPLNRAIGDFA